jgi:hypothetical protein
MSKMPGLRKTAVSRESRRPDLTKHLREYQARVDMLSDTMTDHSRGVLSQQRNRYSSQGTHPSQMTNKSWNMVNA